MPHSISDLAPTDVKRAIAAIREWLRKAGLGLKLSDNDIIHNFILPARGFVERRKGASSGSKGVVFQRAWHGSPHRGIEKEGFKLSKIGTGEGAQAYGWGIYFAGREEVAESYRRELGGSFSVDGRPIFLNGKRVGTTGTPHIDDLLLANLGDVEASIKEQAAYLESLDASTDVIAHERQVLKQLQALRDRVSVVQTGQLYNANIPENHELIDYEKPFSQQPPAVKKAIRKIWASIPDNGMREIFGPLRPDSQGKDLYGTILEIAYEIGTEQDTDGDFDKNRIGAEFLAQHGIPGLRYLDGTSRHASQDSYNYVIWDEARLNDDIKTYFSRGKQDLRDGQGAQVQSDANQQSKFNVPSEGISKSDAETTLATLAGKPLRNKETGIEAFINTTQANKLVSNAAVNKSMANGFTREQHYAITAKIETLWDNAVQIDERADKKGHPDIRIKRFVAPVVLDGQTNYAVITVKSVVHHGHRIYTLEAHAEKTLRGMLDKDITNNSDKPNAPSRSVDDIIKALEEKVNTDTRFSQGNRAKRTVLI